MRNYSFAYKDIKYNKHQYINGNYEIKIKEIKMKKIHFMLIEVNGWNFLKQCHKMVLN